MSKVGFCNEDCLITMDRMIKKDFKVNLILTSPPYNTSRKSHTENSIKTHQSRYDIYNESLTAQEYIDWSVNLFNKFS